MSLDPYHRLTPEEIYLLEELEKRLSLRGKEILNSLWAAYLEPLPERSIELPEPPKEKK
jgi:hypothetical protein